MPKYKKFPVACHNCRKSKIKCDRNYPCSKCTLKGLNCGYPDKFRSLSLDKLIESPETSPMSRPSVSSTNDLEKTESNSSLEDFSVPDLSSFSSVSSGSLPMSVSCSSQIGISAIKKSILFSHQCESMFLETSFELSGSLVSVVQYPQGVDNPVMLPEFVRDKERNIELIKTLIDEYFVFADVPNLSFPVTTPEVYRVIDEAERNNSWAHFKDHLFLIIAILFRTLNLLPLEHPLFTNCVYLKDREVQIDLFKRFFFLQNLVALDSSINVEAMFIMVEEALHGEEYDLCKSTVLELQNCIFFQELCSYVSNYDCSTIEDMKPKAKLDMLIKDKKLMRWSDLLSKFCSFGALFSIKLFHEPFEERYPLLRDNNLKTELKLNLAESSIKGMEFPLKWTRSSDHESLLVDAIEIEYQLIYDINYHKLKIRNLLAGAGLSESSLATISDDDFPIMDEEYGQIDVDDYVPLELTISSSKIHHLKKTFVNLFVILNCQMTRLGLTLQSVALCPIPLKLCLSSLKSGVNGIMDLMTVFLEVKRFLCGGLAQFDYDQFRRVIPVINLYIFKFVQGFFHVLHLDPQFLILQKHHISILRQMFQQLRAKIMTTANANPLSTIIRYLDAIEQLCEQMNDDEQQLETGIDGIPTKIKSWYGVKFPGENIIGRDSSEAQDLPACLEVKCAFTDSIMKGLNLCKMKRRSMFKDNTEHLTMNVSTELVPLTETEYNGTLDNFYELFFDHR
ncbi:BA75_01850T0 [Komagataella pastoris]|uniref:BA75_01850T0 n=1 Tax=Komagataella pastoris TaxID=4922 RepID=A0A1B2J9Q3_PICPA|nr:BA75_01850T0 [Komagataella pastoris]